MNETENAKTFSPSASEYISDNFKPSDRIAVLVLNRHLRRDDTADHDGTEGGQPRIPGMAPLQERKRG